MAARLAGSRKFPETKYNSSPKNQSTEIQSKLRRLGSMFGRCGRQPRDLNDDILKYSAKELNEHLPRFFAEIRKSDGSEYESDSLRVMLADLDRYLRQNESKISIAKDRKFMVCRHVLWGKSKSSSRERLRKTTKCNKSTYCPRWRAAMEERSTRRPQSKIIIYYLKTTFLWLFRVVYSIFDALHKRLWIMYTLT